MKKTEEQVVESEVAETVEETVVSEVKTEKKSKSAKNTKKSAPRPSKKEKDNRFEERVVAINRISKTVKGGRKMRFSALVVVGDGKGYVGFGTGKANEVPDAIKKALEAAKKNLYKIPMVKGGTFPHEIMGEYGAAKVFMKPAPIGAGIIAGGPVRAVLELAGIKNVYSKVYGSRTPINVVRATINGIENMKTVSKMAALRGKDPKEILA